MPEYDAADRTEEATPRKLEEGRRKGHVARSPDLSAAVILLGAAAVLKLWGHYPLKALVYLTRGALGNMAAPSLGPAEVCGFLGSGGLFLLKALMPLVGGLLFVAFLGNVTQTGFLFSGEPLVWRLDRLNPAEGLKRLVSRRALVRLIANLFKVAVVGLVAYFAICSQFGVYTELTGASVGEIFVFVMDCTFTLVLRIGIALLALALLDYVYQRWQFREDMRMTRQEVRDELKRMEGDPLTRDRRRRMQRNIAMQRMIQGVRAADVVVTNPTELAVALCYRATGMAAPTVVAKGRGPVAARIRATADEGGIPIIERVPLARMLWRTCQVGGPVPAELYPPVAEVLAFVHELNRMKTKQRPVVA